MGPGQLYQDLQNLIHDLSLVNQISSMIGSLKGNYQVPAEPTGTHLKAYFAFVHLGSVFYPRMFMSFCDLNKKEITFLATLKKYMSESLCQKVLQARLVTFIIFSPLVS